MMEKAFETAQKSHAGGLDLTPEVTDLYRYSESGSIRIFIFRRPNALRKHLTTPSSAD